MLETLAGQLVLAAKEGTTNTSADAMVEAGLFGADKMTARVNHGGILPMNPNIEIRKPHPNQLGEPPYCSWEIS